MASSETIRLGLPRGNVRTHVMLLLLLGDSLAVRGNVGLGWLTIVIRQYPLHSGIWIFGKKSILLYFTSNLHSENFRYVYSQSASIINQKISSSLFPFCFQTASTLLHSALVCFSLLLTAAVCFSLLPVYFLNTSCVLSVCYWSLSGLLQVCFFQIYVIPTRFNVYKQQENCSPVVTIFSRACFADCVKISHCALVGGWMV